MSTTNTAIDNPMVNLDGWDGYRCSCGIPMCWSFNPNSKNFEPLHIFLQNGEPAGAFGMFVGCVPAKQQTG